MHQSIREIANAAATKCSFNVFPHPAYYPDLALSNFCLFPNLTTNLQGRNFGSNEGVIDAVDEYLGKQEEGYYFERMSRLEQHWRKCIQTKGRLV